MIKYTATLAILWLFSTFSFAQGGNYAIEGTVVDSTDAPLEWASILLFNPQDSTMMAFAYSDAKGQFKMKNLKSRDYILKIGFLGLTAYEDSLYLESDLNVGIVKLVPYSAELGEVEVTATRIPILIKKDTIEYDAQSFRVRPNANVEELLKQLPGVEVDQDGGVTAQGEEVKNVLVDGRRFFGNDPKLATKNLPADAVDKVQIYDRKSETSEFTGIDDGTREKTINLQLKPDRKNGAFGYASGAYGVPDDRFDGKLSLNKFSDTRQFAILAGGNNINQQGFSFQDYMQFSGGMQGGMGGRGGGTGDAPINRGRDNGFTTAFNGGIQYTERWGKENELNTSYFYNRVRELQESELERLTFLPDGGQFVTLEDANSLNTNANHRLNINYDQTLDTFSAIKIISNFSITAGIGDQFQTTFNEGRGGLTQDNESINDYLSDGTNWSWNGSATWRRRFEKRGRILATTASGNVRSSVQEARLVAVNSFLMEGLPTEVENINQQQDQDNRNWSVMGNTQYTEPLGNRQYLEFKYSISHAPMRNERLVYDIFGNELQIINPDLSNGFDATFSYHRPGVSYRKVTDSGNFNIGVDGKFSRLDGSIDGLGAPLARTFNFVLPNFRWTYNPVRTKNFNIDYNTSIREPSVVQLQPLADNRDPLNIYIGNPELEPEYAHRLSLRYSSFNPINFQNFFVFGNVSYTLNRIRETQIIDDQLRRVRTPINVRGEWDMFSRINFGYPIQNLGLRFNLSGGLNYNWGLTFVNEVENQTRRLTPSSNLRITYQLKSYLDINIGTGINYTQTNYSVQSELNQSFMTYTHNASIRANWPEKWQFETGLNLAQFRGQAGVFNEDIPIWTASISRFLLAKDRGELKIIAYDLLNRNQGISRVAELNYIEDQRILSLGRYIMVEFRYNINSTPSTSRGRGGMFRFMM